MDVERLLECLVTSIGRDILVSYEDYVNSLTLYKSVEEAEHAPVEAAIRNFNYCDFREYNITFIRFKGKIYPIIKPGVSTHAERLSYVPEGAEVILDLHSHPGIDACPDSGDLSNLLGEERKPMYYGVIANDDGRAVAVVIEVSEEVCEVLKRVVEELKRIEEELKAKAVSYAPIPGILINWSICRVSDEELVAKCIEVADKAYSVIPEPFRALSTALREVLEYSRMQVSELRPEHVEGVMSMPVSTREDLERATKASLDILRKHLGNNLREYMFKLSS